MSDLQITPLSLLFTSVLVLLSLFISYKEELGFGKDIIVAALRAFIQLSIAGFMLTKIFDIDSIYVSLLAILIIILNASWNASKRGENIENSFRIALISIGITTVIILGVLLFSGSLKFVPSQVIPITGMTCEGTNFNVSGRRGLLELSQLLYGQLPTCPRKTCFRSHAPRSIAWPDSTDDF